MVLRGWLFTDLIAPRCSLAARHARSFRFWPALSCRASRQYFCSVRARPLLLGCSAAFEQCIKSPDAPSEQRRLPYMLLLTTEESYTLLICALDRGRGSDRSRAQNLRKTRATLFEMN